MMEIKPRPVKKARANEKQKSVNASKTKKEAEINSTVKKETNKNNELEKSSLDDFSSTSIDNSNNLIEVNSEQSCQVNFQNCVPQEKTIYNVRLARAYVPFQKFCTTYVPLESLKRGTVFPELDL